MELFFDTETSDIFNFKTQYYFSKNFPWPVQVGAVLAENGIAYAELNVIIRPNGRKIAEGAFKVHQINTDLADRVGISERDVCCFFSSLIENADILIAHNWEFDSNIMAAAFTRNYFSSWAEYLLEEKEHFCTMKETTNICKLSGRYGKYKWPKLSELYMFLFNEKMIGAHDAMYDIRATMKCYYALKDRGLI